MLNDRQITVAIHTYDRALELKALLEREGVAVTLNNVNLDTPVVSSGVRVRIHEADLPMALRIIENQDLFQTSSEATNEGSNPFVLVPVDFSDYSEQACEVAFRLASLYKADIDILHSYINPVYTDRIQLSDVLSYDEPNSADTDRGLIVEQEARRQMERLVGNLREKIKSGVIPAVKFTTEIIEGLPEESINSYAKQHSPKLIVMGTRGLAKKERDLVGSVTAEVLDTCRYPVFTVPDSVDVNDVDALDSVLFFSNFDQEDILALDAMFAILPISSLNVVLVAIPGKKQDPANVNSSLMRLGEYCRQHYPSHNFSIDTLSITSIDDDFERISRNLNGKLIVVPNKKKNILARLFNPGIAHRILFHSDIPMVVIPV